MKFVMLNSKTGSYWSNESGWTDLFSCDKFTVDQSHQMNLPIDGVWITRRAAQNLKNGILEI